MPVQLRPGLLGGVPASDEPTYLRFREGASREVEFPNGIVRTVGSAGRLQLVADRFGNALEIAYGNHNSTINEFLVWTLTDAHGRSHTVELKVVAGGTAAVVSRVNLGTFGGGTGK